MRASSSDEWESYSGVTTRHQHCKANEDCLARRSASRPRDNIIHVTEPAGLSSFSRSRCTTQGERTIHISGRASSHVGCLVLLVFPTRRTPVVVRNPVKGIAGICTCGRSYLSHGNFAVG